MVQYLQQKKYFENAYRTGEHGWPIEKPSSFVVEFQKKIHLLARPQRVLDMGCGEGRHTFLFARKGWLSIGMDDQPLALERAKKIAQGNKLSKGFFFVLGDVFCLPFHPLRFDILLDYGVLHHIRRRDTPSYLKAVVPLLKTNGYFLLSCFSKKFKHYPGEERKRNWLVHHGHYDRFFKKSDFQVIFGKFFNVLKIHEERQGCYVFYHILMRKKNYA